MAHVTCQLSNGLKLHGGDGSAETANGLLEVVRVDVAHANMGGRVRVILLWTASVDVNKEGLQYWGIRLMNM